jgi:YfiH family protein
MAPTPLVLRSSLLTDLGFRHGFSLRTGGVSAPPFDSLNLGRAVGDSLENVEENHRRFAEAVGYDAGDLLEVSQVHGNRVHTAVAPDGALSLRSVKADALVTRNVGTPVGVRVADCIPLLLADRKGRAVAAVHVGWRGAVARIAHKAVESLEALGARRADLAAVIGPHIRAEAFEVGEEVAHQIAAAAEGAEVIRTEFVKPHADLAKTLTAQLRALGVSEIDDVGGCTHDEPDRFFSYRRDGARSGRHLAAIVAGSR